MTHLRDLNYYEDRYNDSTVEICRRGERIVNQTFVKMENKLPKGELKQRSAGWYLQYSIYYFWFVESTAAARCENRDKDIDKWMKQDEDKDRRLAEARIAGGCTLEWQHQLRWGR